MGVQKKILKRTVLFDLADGNEFLSGTGVLIGGTPGQIYDVAFDPVVHTMRLAVATDLGAYISGQGVLVNAPEYALYGNRGIALEASATIPADTVVSVMTTGHVWVRRGTIAEIESDMKVYVAYMPDGVDADDLCLVELKGFKNAIPPPPPPPPTPIEVHSIDDFMAALQELGYDVSSIHTLGDIATLLGLPMSSTIEDCINHING